MGKHLAPAAGRGVTRSRPTTPPASEAIAGFRRRFEAGGGRVVGEAKPPFGTTPGLPAVPRRHPGVRGRRRCSASSPAPRRSRSSSSTGSSGWPAGSRCTAAASSPRAACSTAQGDAASACRRSLHYTDQLDNPANKRVRRRPTRPSTASRPTVYAVQTWDAADVLDRALGGATALDGDAIVDGARRRRRDRRQPARAVDASTARRPKQDYVPARGRQSERDGRDRQRRRAARCTGAAEPVPALARRQPRQRSLNGLAIGLLLFILAVGLSLVFGMMDVLNLAHGALFLAGAYLAVRAGRRRQRPGATCSPALAAAAVGGARRGGAVAG